MGAITKDVVHIQPSRSVYADIATFLDDKGIHSANTRRSYEASIKDFFLRTRGKDIADITEDDLKYRNAEVINYRNFLVDTCGLSAATVNNRMAAIRSLMDFLARDYEFIRVETFNTGKKLREKTKSHGQVTWLEAKQMIELAEKIDPKNGLEKSALIEVAARTSTRLNALLSMKWENIERVNDIWVIKVWDKGTVLSEHAIPNHLHEKLMKLKEDGRETVFTYSDRQANRIVQDLAEMIGIPKERGVVFHSLRNTVVNEILSSSGDILGAAEHTGHKDINIMIKHYNRIKRNSNLATSPSMIVGEELDMTPVNELSHEELLAAVNSLSDPAKFELLSLLKK